MNDNKKKNENLVTTAISDTLKNALLKEKTTYVAARTSKLQRGIAEKILEETKTQFELKSREEALVVIAILFQQGGTARSCDGNMSISIFDKEFKLADLRKILKKLSCNKGERKLARTLATEIFEVAKTLEIPGNLYQKIQKLDLKKTFSLTEKVWLSDFQSDNEDCPLELRELILNSFKSNKEKNKKKNNTNVWKN